MVDDFVNILKITELFTVKGLIIRYENKVKDSFQKSDSIALGN